MGTDIRERQITNLKTKNPTDTEVPEKKKGALRENIEAIIVAVILALFIRTFIIQAFKIPSGSMKPTLQIGDHILVNKFLYGVKLPFIDKTIIDFKKPKRGDIVVFKFPEDPDKDFIKRVIGVTGDIVEGRDKKIYVNGELQQHDYAVNIDPRILPGNRQPRDNFGPVTVPEEKLFVMGDNRDHSYDSRFWGFVELKKVRGKAFIIYWSWDKPNFDVRWGRFGQLLK